MSKVSVKTIIHRQLTSQRRLADHPLQLLTTQAVRSLREQGKEET